MKRSELTIITLFAVLWHAAWSELLPLPVDWDGWYYLTVAKHIAAGEGAITQGLWNLGILPQSLPMTADSYWMPLPSRILVPGLWLFPDGGDRLITVLLATAWLPVAWALARELDLSVGVQRAAAWLAASGGAYAGLLEQPDCYALTGLLGGLALLAVARKQAWAAALCAVALALSRNDGFLLGLALGWGFSGRSRWLVALAGPAAFALWTARNLAIFGPDYLAARALVAQTSDYLSLFDGVNHAPVGFWAKLAIVPGYSGDLVAAWVQAGALWLVPGALWFAWRRRTHPVVRVTCAWWLAVPTLTLLLTPVVCDHGTLMRTAVSATLGVGALGLAGSTSLLAIIVQRRGYHPLFLPILLSCATALISLLSVGKLTAFYQDFSADCAAITDLGPGPVFSGNPIAIEAQCGRPAVLWTTHTTPERMRDLIARYGITGAYVPVGSVQGEPSLTPELFLRRLPDARPVTPESFAIGPTFQTSPPPAHTP